MTCAMRVVSNTSPLLNLAIIGQLALVQQQFGQVWIPPAVLGELQPDVARPGSSEIREASGRARRAKGSQISGA